jgi:glycosyltransferase involved in cell wall biosynthesis
MIIHRLHDLLVGGAEVVVLNTIKATPEFQHTVLFSRYSPSWIARELECQSNAKLIRIENSEVKSFLFQSDAKRFFFHYYPPMSENDFRDLPNSILSKSFLVNHWHSPLPKLDVIRYVFLSAESRRTTGNAIPCAQSLQIMNPVADEFFRVERRVNRAFTIGRHSRDVDLKFSDDCLAMYESIDIPGLDVRILGATDKLKTLVSQNLERLRHNYYLLPINSLRVPNFVAELDLYVYKTNNVFAETCPMNILEAMATGIPVVAENKGGIRNLIQHGETGFLCDSNHDFKRHTETLFRDKALRERMSIAAKKWAHDNVSTAIFRSNMIPLLAQ